VSEQPTQPARAGQDSIDPLRKRGRQHSGPLERPAETFTNEERLVRLALAEARHDGRDLGDLPANMSSVVPASSRSTWITTSRASTKMRRTIDSVTFSPAMSAAFTSAFTASRALLACTVQRKPHPALIARVSSNASAPRTSPTTIRSGRIARTNFTKSRRLISPVPSRPAGRTS
jgi:hypothetical protein